MSHLVLLTSALDLVCPTPNLMTWGISNQQQDKQWPSSEKERVKTEIIKAQEEETERL